MDIEPLSVDQSLCGHQISMKGGTTMYIIKIGTTIQDKVVTIIKSMDMFLKTILEHISRVITKGG